MAKKKLTPKLKEQIKANYHQLRQSDFDGDALRYLKQVRAGHKGQKALQKKRKEQTKKIVDKAVPKGEGKKGKTIVIDGKKIEPGSLAHDIIVKSAENKNQSVAKFVKENKEQLGKLLANYLIFERKEIDDLRRLIKALPDDSKVISPIKAKAISRDHASFLLHMIKKALMELCSIYPIVFIEFAFDLEANLHFNCPRPKEYKEFEACHELKEYLEDRYLNITWIDND